MSSMVAARGMARQRSGFVIGFLVAGMTGCISHAGVVTKRFSGEFNCPEEQVSVTELGGNAHRAAGCRRTAIYTCIGPDGNAIGDSDAVTCVKDD